MNNRLQSNRFIGKAWDLEQKGRHGEALNLARQAVGEDPANPSARHTLALLLSRMGLFEEAEKELVSILTIYPHFNAVWEDLSVMLLAQKRERDYESLMNRIVREAPENHKLRATYGRYLINRHRYPEAELYLEKMIGEDDHDAEAHYQLGLIHLARDRYRWAVKEFHLALEKDAEHHEAFLDICATHLELGEAETAVKLLEKYLPHHTGDLPARALLANALFDMGEEDGAMNILNGMREQFSDDPWTALYLAEAEAELGKMDEARLLTKEIEEATNSHDLLLRTAQLHEYLGDFERATSLYKRLQVLNPDDIDVYLALGSLYLEMGEVELSRVAFETALEKRPEDPELHFQMGSVLADRGEFLDARLHFEKAVRYDYQYVEAYTSLGVLVLEQMGLPERAAEVFEAGMVWGDSELLRSNYVECLRELSRFAEAEQILREVLRSTPDSPTTLVQLGNLLFDTGRRIEARACFERALESDPEWAIPYHGLGCCLWEDGEKDLGLDYIRLAAGMGSEVSVEFLQDLGLWNDEEGQSSSEA